MGKPGSCLKRWVLRLGALTVCETVPSAEVKTSKTPCQTDRKGQERGEIKSEVSLFPSQSQSTCISGPPIPRIQQRWKMCREGQQQDPRSLHMGSVKNQGSLAQERDSWDHRAEFCTAGGGGRG